MVNGVGLGNMAQNLMGLSVVYGINSVVETLCSQAYGAGQKKLCGVYLHRARIILTFAYIPIVLSLFQVENMLVWLK